MAKNEPQSYGSEKEWLTGDTGQTVNRLKGPPNSQHADFYASRPHEESAPDQGGKVSADSRDQAEQKGSSDDAQTPVQKVTAKEQGARRQSFWKDRDYKS
jgi:hypothetical protein